MLTKITDETDAVKNRVLGEREGGLSPQSTPALSNEDTNLASLQGHGDLGSCRARWQIRCWSTELPERHLMVARREDEPTRSLGTRPYSASHEDATKTFCLWDCQQLTGMSPRKNSVPEVLFPRSMASACHVAEVVDDASEECRVHHRLLCFPLG
jgi:hypothetical protein